MLDSNIDSVLIHLDTTGTVHVEKENLIYSCYLHETTHYYYNIKD